MNIGLVYREYAYDLVSRPGYTSGVSATSSTQSTPQWSSKASQPPDIQQDDKDIVSNSHLDIHADHYVLGGEKYSLLEQTECAQEIMVSEKIKEGRKNILSENESTVHRTDQKGEVAYSPETINMSKDLLDYDVGDSWQIGKENYRIDTAAFNRTYQYQKESMGMTGTASTTATTNTSASQPTGPGQLGGIVSMPSSVPINFHDFAAALDEPNGCQAETKIHVSLGLEFDVGTGNLPINFNKANTKSTDLHTEELGRQVRLDEKIRSNEALNKIAEKGDDRFQDHPILANSDQSFGTEDRNSAENADPRPLLAKRTEAYKLAQNELRSYRNLEYNLTPPDSALLINPLPPTLGPQLDLVSLEGRAGVAASKSGTSVVGDYINSKYVGAMSAGTRTGLSQRGSVDFVATRGPAQTYLAEGPPLSLGLERTAAYSLTLNPIPTITESNDITKLDAASIYVGTDYGSISFQLNSNDLEHRIAVRQATPITLNLQRLPMSNELDRDRVDIVTQSPTEQTVQVFRPENYFDHTSHFLKLTQAARVPEVPTDFVTDQKHLTLRHNIEKHVDKAKTAKITENQLYGRDDPRIQEVITLREIRQMDKFEKQTEYLEGQHTPPSEKPRGNVISDPNRGTMLSSLVWGWHNKQ